MQNKSDEIECPVCDKQIIADVRKCPYCGADFESHDLSELEEIADELVRRESRIIVDQQISSSTTQVSYAPTGHQSGQEKLSTKEIESTATQFSSADQNMVAQKSSKPPKKEKKSLFGIFKSKKN